MSIYYKKPDYEYWGEKELWSFEEANSLLMGYDPEVVNWKTLTDPIDAKNQPEIENQDALQEMLLDAWYDGVLAQKGGMLSTGEPDFCTVRLPPRDFIKWANTQGIKPADQLTRAVIQHEERLSYEQLCAELTGTADNNILSTEPKGPTPAARDTLLRIIGLFSLAITETDVLKKKSNFGNKSTPNQLEIAKHLTMYVPANIRGLSDENIRKLIAEGLKLLE